MLKAGINDEEIKKIFGPLNWKGLKRDYLNNLSKYTGKPLTIPDDAAQLVQMIKDTWNYEDSKAVIREMFKQSDKYIRGSQCLTLIEDARKSWNEKNLGEFKWPFEPDGFDNRAHRINTMSISEDEKDNLLCNEVIKVRRIKDINTKRNDFIEYLIFEHNDTVIPTLQHKRSVDFYLDGEPFDQKVSKGVGNAFKKQFGDNYRQTALEHPELVAQSLYVNQNADRFDANSRLYVVYLDEDMPTNNIVKELSGIDFSHPLSISFDYNHQGGAKHYENIKCFVVLLHN